MILVDTNVVSETMRANPDPRVTDWLDAQAFETLHLSTISLAELLFGIEALPDGKRKAQLGRALDQATGLFGPRLLTFDIDAARAYGAIMSRARRAGRPLGIADGQIASVAAAHKLAVATRDVVPFEATGLTVVNPWQASP